jgi:hypothetical protein
MKKSCAVRGSESKRSVAFAVRGEPNLMQSDEY